MTISRKLVLDEKGEPTEVIIPYAQFVEIVEAYGLDLQPEEARQLRVAREDAAHGRRDQFISADEI